jgi:hypothetical protein
LLSGYYTIKPEKDGYSFEPPNYMIQNLTSVLQGIDFEATKILCPIEIFDGEDSDETEHLRHFRDNLLSQTPEGQKLIKRYYQWSPMIVKMLEEDKEFKEEARKMIDGVLPLISGKRE